MTLKVMAAKTAKNSKPSSSVSIEIASPQEVIAAAERMPRVFNMAAYFRAVYVMRDRGHSWRAIADWLKQFNIEVSYVHLRRLYRQESERLSRLTSDELDKLGMPAEMIKDVLERSDPDGRMAAADPEDQAIEAKRTDALRGIGVPEEMTEDIDVTEPIKLTDKEI